MTDEIHIDRVTKASVQFCPRCGSSSIEQTTKGIAPGALDTNYAKCLACEWYGYVHQLLVTEFEHESGSQGEIARALMNDMRALIAAQAGQSLAKWLAKWGFLDTSKGTKEMSTTLGRYVAAIAHAAIQAVILEREKIEKEKVSG